MKRLALPAILALSVLAAGCGSQSIDVAAEYEEGARLFVDNCAGCHTLDVTGSQGSATEIGSQERVDGPNFNTRPEDVEGILYAIRNGGFSGAVMPENIVVGEDAQKVAEFLAEYAGRDAAEAREDNESDSGSSGGSGP